MCGLIVFRTNEPIITEQCHTQRKFAIGLFNQTHLFVDRLETAASADFDTQIDRRRTQYAAQHRQGNTDAQRHGVFIDIHSAESLVIGTITNSGPVGPAFQCAAYIRFIGGVFDPEFNRIRVPVSHIETGCGFLDQPRIAASPVLIDVIPPTAILGVL